jgi:CRP/FNR family cyclic AMP-dependent transcriptional regulator
MLERMTIFAGLHRDEIGAIEHCAVVRHFPKNAVVVVEGDGSDALYAILEGRVKVYLTDERGREIVVNIKEAGDYFGELAALGETPRTASVMTLEPSKFAIVPAADFKACLKRQPDLAMGVIRAMARHIGQLTGDVRDLALLDVYQRVTRLLLKLAVEQDGKPVVNQRPSQQDIANQTGASREMVGRVMKELAIGGYITIEDKRIVIEKKLPTGW